MSNKKKFKSFILIFSCLFIISCNKNIDILVLNEKQKDILVNYILLKCYNVKIIDNDYYLTIKNINKELLVDMLYMLNIKIDIIKNNIVNVKTTRTVEGGPFIRNYLKITVENGMEILKDTSDTFHVRVEFDPSHPDAIKDGVNKDYVQYPNINLIYEYNDLIETIQLYNSIVDYIKNNYKNIAIEKINTSTIDEIENNIKIENMLELILKFSLENKN